MAYTDPQTVTINSVAQTLARTGMTDQLGTFQKDDGTVVLLVGQQKGRRNRRSLRLNFRKIAADPLMADRNLEYTMSAYLVVDVPTVGFTVAEAKQVVDALTAYLTASSGARVTQLLGGEL